jgi:hypothetical protein
MEVDMAPMSNQDQTVAAVTDKIKKLHSDMSPAERAVLRGILKQASVGSNPSGTFSVLKNPPRIVLSKELDFHLLIADSEGCW